MSNLKSILVLGSNGFIGSHLVSWFRDQGLHVIGIDQAKTSENRLELQPPHQFAQLCLPDPQLSKILCAYRPEAVINAAGPASVSKSLVDPSTDFSGSIWVCFHILESIRENLPDCKLLQLSSAAVYGNPAELPIPENAPLEPISPYGYHKLICETLMDEYAKIFKLKTCSIRIFSAFGPGLRKQVLWDIYHKISAEGHLCLFGTGEETRDFIYVCDIAQGISLILEKGDFRGGVYNLANGVEISIRRLTRCFLDKLGLNGTETHFSGIGKPGDPQKWCADTRKIKRLGYAPRYDIEQGLEDYARWIERE